MLYFLLLWSSYPMLVLHVLLIHAMLTTTVLHTTAKKGIVVKNITMLVRTVVLEIHATQMTIVLRMNAVMLQKKHVVKLANAIR